MACRYFVGGYSLTEAQFKKVLNDGLLDQLLVKQGIDIPGFNIKEEFIESTLESAKQGPVELRVVSKINKQVNNQLEKVSYTEGDVIDGTNRRSAARKLTTVIKEANDQIKKENKRLNKKRKPIDLILVTSVGGKLQYGENISKKVVQEIEDSPYVNLEDGFIYMLVPSSYGLYPIRLESRFLGETNVGSQVKENVKKLFTETDNKVFDNIAKNISRFLYKTTIKKTPEGVNITTTKADKEQVSKTFETAEELITFILGDRAGKKLNKDKDGNLSTNKGLLAHVNSLKINNNIKDLNSLSNDFYANNEFITTDVYTEGGNFFNSSSFVVEAFNPTTQTTKVLGEILSSSIPVKEESEASSKIVKPIVKEETKEDELPINNKTIEEVQELQSIYIPIENSNLQYRVYVRAKENTLEMYEVEKGSLVAVPNSNAKKWKVSSKANSKETSIARKEAKPKFDELKKQFGTKDTTTPEGGIYRDPKTGEDVGTGLFDNPIVEETESTPETDTNISGIFDYGEEGDVGEDLDIKPRTRTVDNKENATQWDKEKELKWLEDKLGREVLDGKVSLFNSVEDLESYLPKETYEMLLEARKNGKFLNGLFTKAAMHIANNAFDGTGFHEAFHVVFNLGLNLEQRIGLLNEAVEKYSDEISPEATLIEIEEVLADKFMEYVQAEGEVKGLAGKIGKWFKAMFRGFKLFFNKNSVISITDLFSDIQLGVYKNKITFENTDLTKLHPENIKLRETESTNKSNNDPVPQLDPRLKKDAFQYMENRLFQELDKIREENADFKNLSDSELINEISKQGGIKRIYGVLLYRMSLDAKASANAGKDISNLLEIWNAFTNNSKAIEKTIIAGKGMPIFKLGLTPLAKEFNRSLRSRGININLDSIEDLKYTFTEEEENSFAKDVENSTAEERWQQAYIEINPQESLSQLTRRRLSTIPKMIIVDGEEVRATNRLGIPINYSEKEVFAYLAHNITDSYSHSKMVNRLKELSDKKPFIEEILNMIQKYPNFKNSLYTTLASKTFQKFLMVLEVDGNYRTFYSNRKSIDNLITETMINGFVVDENPLFDKHDSESELKGQIDFETPIKKKVSEQIARLNSLTERSKVTTTKEEITDFISDFAKFLKDNHLSVSEDQLLEIWNPDTENTKSKWNNIVKLLSSTGKIFKELEQGRNPFLQMRVSDDSVFKNVLKEFVFRAKSGMEKDLSIAFVNGNKKAVYAVQYSNYLNKLISKFKNPKDFKEYKAEIANDPLLSSMPMITDLLTEEGEASQLMDNLETVIFDSLARSGKNTNVDYSDLSDIEIESMAMAAFFKQGNKSNYGYYKLPIPADNSVLPLIQYKKYDFKEVVDRFVQVANAERKRINFFKNLPEDSSLLLIENFKKNAGKYHILNFLNGKVSENTSVDDIRIIIEDHLLTEFLELQKEKYKDAGIIKEYEKGPNGKITFTDGVISKSQEKNSSEFFKSYLFNSYLMNTQMTTIFAGDPAFYTGTGDYQKRYKQIVSPGTFTNSEIIYDKYSGLVFNDEVAPTESYVVDNIIDLVRASDLPAENKKELIARWESTRSTTSDKGHNNLTDAATFISLDRAKNILVSLDRYTPAHKKAFERIKKGIEKPEDSALFSVSKPFMFSKMNIEGVEVPIQIKNSEVLLTKALAYKKDADGNFMRPKLVAAYDLLNNPKPDGPQIDFIAFESAVKVGAIGSKLDEEGNVTYNELVEDDEGKLILNGPPAIVTLDHADWRLQQEVPPKYEDASGNFGSQLRNLIISDMSMDGIYKINKKDYTGREVARMYQDLIVENLQESYEDVEEMFLDEDGEIDYKKITTHLRAEITRINLGEEYFKAIELVDNVRKNKKTPTLPLWHPLVSYKVESLLNSFFKNNVTKQKIKGGAMVNATSYGVSEELEFYIDKNGNYLMEALLPWWTKRFFPKNKDGEIDLKTLPKELTALLGYRIPTEDKYSMFNIKVVGFTDSAAGGTIILPQEATTQAGLDFDIDKLSMIIPEYRITKEGKIEYKKYLNENSSAEEIVDAIFDSNSSYESFVNKYVPKSSQKRILKLKEEADQDIFNSVLSRNNWKEDVGFTEIVTEIKDLTEESKKETDPVKKAALKKQINSLRNKIYEEKDLFDAGVNTAHERYKTLKKNIAGFVETISKDEYVDFNTRATRNNQLLQIMIGIMENKETALSIIDSGNFDKLIELGTSTRILQLPKGSDLKVEGMNILEDFKSEKIDVLQYRELLKDFAKKLDDKDFNINYPSTQLTLFRRNMTGKKLIGIFANHNANHAKAQYTSLALEKNVYFDGVEYNSLHDVKTADGERISKSLAIKLAAVVDNAKEPVSAYLNMNTYTANVIAYLSRLGVKEDTIFAFVNQPAIVELTKEHFNEKGSAATEKNRVDKHIAQLRGDLGINNISLDSIEMEEGNLNLKELQDALDNNNSKETLITQYKALVAFKDHYNIAEELSQITQASKVDTQPVGPSNGENYVMINKQQRVLNRSNSMITGKEELFFTESEQLINPAFNKYGWLKPLGILDKVFPSIGKVSTETGNIQYSMLGKVKNFFSELKGEFSLTASEARKIDSFFMSYIGSKLPFFDYKDATRVLNEVPDTLRKYKEENPDSIYMPLLEALYTKDATRTVPVRRIEYYNTGKSNLDHEEARAAWEQMLTAENAKDRKLALDLVKYTFFSNGYSFSSYSFFNMIPVEFWKDSFAKEDINKGVGLLDENNNSFNTIAELVFEDLKNEPAVGVDGYITQSGAVYNFIKQFIQNTAEKSMVVPSLNLKEDTPRGFTPKKGVLKLAPDEVFVFGTTQEGAHNIDAAGFAFSGNATTNKSLYKKGDTGKWTQYGITGQITLGTEGQGFGIRMQKATFKDGSLEKIEGPKQLEEAESRKLITSMKSDLRKLIKAANENNNKTFIVGNLDNSTNDTGRTSFKIIKQALEEVNKEAMFPENVIFPEKYDPRINNNRKIVKVDNTQSLIIRKAAHQNYKNNDGVFPSFFKVTKNKVTSVYEINKETLDKDYLEYNKIPTLGTNNFIVEFNYNNPINESIVPKIIKKSSGLTLTNKKEIEEKYKEAPPIDPTNSSLFTISTKEVLEDLKDDDYPDIDVLQFSAPTIKSNIETPNIGPKEAPYSEYSTLAKSKKQVPMPESIWEKASALEKASIMIQLKEC